MVRALGHVLRPVLVMGVIAPSTLILACSGTDGVAIGSAPDAGTESTPTSMVPEGAPSLPEAHAADEDAGPADFDQDIAPPDMSDAGVVLPAPLPPQGDPVDALRDACVTSINQYRAAVGRPPLRRWTAAETCVDAQAHIDAIYNTSHRTFRQCTELGQNECPNWPGATGAQALATCLQSQWNGRPNGSLFLNMISSRWTHVSCGFYQTPNGRFWLVQNFR